MHYFNSAIFTILALTSVSLSKPTGTQHRNAARQAGTAGICNVKQSTLNIDYWNILVPDAPPAEGVNKCEGFVDGVTEACDQYSQWFCQWSDEEGGWSIGLATLTGSCQETDLEPTLGELECKIEPIPEGEDGDNPLGFGENVLPRE